MSEAWLLFRILWKNSTTLDLKTKKGKRGIVLMVVLVLCFAPTLLMLYMSFLDAFRQGVFETLMLEVGMVIPCALAAVMACMIVPTVFFFSRDTDLLLPLPVKGSSIVAAKTGMVLTSQVLIGTAMALPVFAAYWTVHPDPAKILVSLIVLATLSLLPVFVIGLVMILLMYLIPGLRNKDRFNLIFGLLTVAMAVGISLLSSSFGANDDLLLELMQNPDDLTLINYVFPQVAWAARAIAQLGISDLCLYLGATLLGLAVFMWVARKCFIPAVTNPVSGTRRSRNRGKERELPAWAACMQTENRMLVRTPAWFMNLLLPPFIIVIVFAAVLLLQGIPELLKNANLPSLTGWMPAIGLMIGMLVGSMNMITSTAISREGQNLWRMKAMPVSVRTQILAKGMVGFAWSVISCSVFMLLVLWMLQGNLLDAVLMMTGILVTSAFVNGLGLLVDGWHPKLVWDDDTTAVKNNFNSVIEMFASWCILLILCLPLFIFGLDDHIGVYTGVAMAVLVLIDLWMILKGPGIIERFLENQI